MALQMCLGSTELSNEKLLLPRTYFPVLTTFQMKAEIRRIRPHCGCIHPGKCFLTKLSVLHLLVFNIIILGGHNFFPKEVLVSAISYRKKSLYFPRQNIFSRWHLNHWFQNISQMFPLNSEDWFWVKDLLSTFNTSILKMVSLDNVIYFLFILLSVELLNLWPLES